MEKILIKGQRNSLKKLVITILAIGVLLGYMGACISIELSSYSWEDYAYKYYSSRLSHAMAVDGAFFFEVFLPPIVFVIIAAIVYFSLSKVELTVTDKRIFGKTKFGKRVDLPLDSVSSVGTGVLKSISVATSSGIIKFSMLKNRDEIHSVISKLLVDRQEKLSTNTNIESTPSNADELKKYKELLDGGIISEAEFEAKKKQLLGF